MFEYVFYYLTTVSLAFFVELIYNINSDVSGQERFFAALIWPIRLGMFLYNKVQWKK